MSWKQNYTAGPRKKSLSFLQFGEGRGPKVQPNKRKYPVELKYEMVIAQLRLIFVLPLVIG